MDSVLLGACSDTAIRDFDDFSEGMAQELVAALRGMRCSGTAYVVFRSQRAVDAVLAASDRSGCQEW